MLRNGRGAVPFTSFVTFKSHSSGTCGFTIVELGVVLTIVGMLFALGMPNALLWIRNSQIRAANSGFGRSAGNGWIVTIKRGQDRFQPERTHVKKPE